MKWVPGRSKNKKILSQGVWKIVSLTVGMKTEVGFLDVMMYVLSSADFWQTYD
jgi:hypothetical protein